MTKKDLRAKYGPSAFDAGQQLQPKTFAHRLALRDSLDQHYTKLWMDFVITGMMQRPALDTRTRLNDAIDDAKAQCQRGARRRGKSARGT